MRQVELFVKVELRIELTQFFYLSHKLKQQSDNRNEKSRKGRERTELFKRHGRFLSGTQHTIVRFLPGRCPVHRQPQDNSTKP